jgi:RND family efflux transporter MFP subunit
MTNKLFHASIIIASAVSIASCGSQPPPPKAPPVAVNVYTVHTGAAVYFDSYPATVVPLNQVDLRAQVTGYISGINFQDGQHVTKGQKLYAIDQQQYEANLQQAKANMNVLQSAADKAQQDADRYQDLYSKDAIAKQILDHAVADLAGAKMQVAGAKAAVDKAELDLQYATITAPYTGTIGISQVKLGTLVTANETLLNSISSDDPMAVDIAIDQQDIPRFEELQTSSKAKDSVFTLALPDNSIYAQPGSISFLDRAVDPQTGTIKVRLVFPNAKNFLKAGMNCNVRVKNNGAGANFLLAPYKSVVDQLGESFVYVANNNKAIAHKVTLGTKINDKVVITSGLQEGDSVITDGVQKLRDSADIQIGAPKTTGK